MSGIILLEIDGLSWNVLHKLISDKKLPNINHIIKNGSYGIDLADQPIISPKIWTSIHTGQTADKHGIVDFYFNEQDFQFPQIWDILTEKKYKVGVYRALSAVLVRKLDGFFIPSFLSFETTAHPDKLSFISELDQKARINKDQGASASLKIKTFIKLMKNGFPIKILIKLIFKTIPLLFNKDPTRRRIRVKKLEFYIHTNMFLKLIKNYQTDVSIFYENSCDIFSHGFWKEFEKNLKFREVIPESYALIDKFIGKVKKFANKYQNTIIILSDHGFAGLNDSDTMNMIKGMDLIVEMGLENDVYPINLAGGSFLRIKDNSRLSFQDLRNMFSKISLNNDKFFDYDEIQGRLYVKLNYKIDISPNMEITLPKNHIIPLSSIIAFNSSRSGRHAEENGVFLCIGPNIKKQHNVGQINPSDIAPTVLALLDTPIPSSMDGKVIGQIFQEKPHVEFYDDKFEIKKEKQQLSKEEEEIIKERLRVLGYID